MPHWYWSKWVERQRTLLSRKIEDVCDELRAEEARTVKALKLDGLWEPSPFPVEVPKDERVEPTSEPTFGRTPWIETPPWLLGKVPEQPGEVRFAENEFERGNETVLLVPLTREVAEDRHRTGRNYVLAARLANGDHVVLRHYTGWSPHDPVQPKNPNYVPSRMFILQWFTQLRRLRARFSNYSLERDMIQLEEVAILEGAGATLAWKLSIHLRTIAGPPKKHLDDRRDGGMVRTWLTLSEPEIDACQIKLPLFADIEPLLRCIVQSIRNEGLGSYV